MSENMSEKTEVALDKYPSPADMSVTTPVAVTREESTPVEASSKIENFTESTSSATKKVQITPQPCRLSLRRSGKFSTRRTTGSAIGRPESMQSQGSGGGSSVSKAAGLQLSSSTPSTGRDKNGSARGGREKSHAELFRKVFNLECFIRVISRPV